LAAACADVLSQLLVYGCEQMAQTLNVPLVDLLPKLWKVWIISTLHPFDAFTGAVSATTDPTLTVTQRVPPPTTVSPAGHSISWLTFALNPVPIVAAVAAVT
jgi:hypothetical protein